MPQPALKAKRLVFKIGSSLLVDETGRVKRPWLDSLATDLATLRSEGRQIMVVTSGSIALGRRALRLPSRTPRLEEKQAAAAIGQILLARAYQESLAEHDIDTAQVLLTLEDTEARRRYLNARATIETLLKLGVMPVINENDTVATSEIRFGDNDRLSARVAVMMLADTLVLLSDVDGLYTSDPGCNSDARHLARVDSITPEIKAMAGGAGSIHGTGGMASKLEAADIATRAGCTVLLAQGRGLSPVGRLLDGANSTLFKAPISPKRARKHWIAASLATTGTIVVDDGAVRALKRGSSLLPIGATSVSGGFERGDTVLVASQDGTQVAKGLSAYDIDDARRIIGRQTAEIETILGWRGRHEMVHRDDLVLI